jgi:hypothetical protein
MGLIFPMPDLGKVSVVVAETPIGEENRSLLRSQPAEVVKPQVKWGRVLAGEAFELGDDED